MTLIQTLNSFRSRLVPQPLTSRSLRKQMLRSGLSVIAGGMFVFLPLGGAKTALAQRIVEVTPGVNSENTTPETPISGLFQSQDGNAVRVESVVIQVNGQDVTSQSTITPNFFSYRPAQLLPLGTNQVRIEYTNTQGVRRAASWSFQVANLRETVAVESLTHNATEAPLSPGETLLATLNGTPGAQSVVYLVQAGQPTQAIAANEVSSGVYVATWAATGNRPGEVIVLGELEKQGVTRFAVAEKSLVLLDRVASNAPGADVTEEIVGEPVEEVETTPVADVPLRPVFTSHREGDEVAGSSFILQGTTRPGVTVQVKVTAVPPRLNLGGVFSVGARSEVVLDQTVTSTVDGEFEVSVPSLDPSGTRYEVEAIATQGGQNSLTQRLNLVRD